MMKSQRRQQSLRQLPKRTYLTRAWNLDDMNSRNENNLGRLKPHRQSYLVVRQSNNE